MAILWPMALEREGDTPGLRWEPGLGGDCGLVKWLNSRYVLNGSGAAHPASQLLVAAAPLACSSVSYFRLCLCFHMAVFPLCPNFLLIRTQSLN